MSKQVREITREELAKHNTAESCWCSYEGEVYDMTSYLSRHPGGKKVLLQCAGGDMTQLYKKYHSYLSISIIGKLKVGILVD